MRICPTQHSWRLRTACAHALPPLYMAIAVTVSNAKRDGTDMGLKKKLSKKPEWLPDWKDESKYPDPKKAVGRVWAWEFLRRNPQYQELWEEYAALPHGLVYSGHSAYALRDISERLEQDFGVRNPARPEMTTVDPEFEWRPIFIEQKPRHWVLPVNVSDDDEFEIPEIHLEDPAEVVVKFDLRAQINPQLIYVAELLKERLKRLTDAKVLRGEPRARFENYPNYLRVLDAKLSGITHETIGAEILKVKDPEYQKPKAVYAFKTAKRLRDGGYRFLAAVGLK
jgi:Family of unknown function (DUF6499)